MDAVDALNEIAFWLERGLAPTFKIQAFRKAAGIIGALDPEEVAARARNGRLKSMKGIGDRTFEVIRQAVDGGVPDYLEDLRQRGQQPLASGGAELRSALRGDLHSHSDWSDGGSPIGLMADAARTLGRDYLALTDHSPNLKIANGLSAERLREQLDVVADINADGGDFRLLAGIEVDILEDGTLVQSPEMLDRLDIVVASVHSKLRMDAGPMTRRMVAAVASPHVDVLGHCTGRLLTGRGRPESEFDDDVVIEACKQFDTAMEVNCRPERLDPPKRILTKAAAAGLHFAISTDAHATEQLEWQPYGTDRAAACGVTGDRVINAMGAGELLEWAGSHPTP